MKKFQLFFFAALAMIFASCGDPNTPDNPDTPNNTTPIEVTGTWQWTKILVNYVDKIDTYKEEGYAEDLNLSVITLKEDGSFTANIVYMKADAATERPEFAYPYEGTWTKNDNKVTFDSKEGTQDINFEGETDGKTFWLNSVPQKVMNNLLYWGGVDPRTETDYAFRVTLTKK